MLLAVPIARTAGTAAAQPKDSGDGQWVLPGRDPANTRYSALTEINTVAQVGTMVGAFFSLVIVAQWITAWMLSPCML